jgi:hypothetical protein
MTQKSKICHNVYEEAAFLTAESELGSEFVKILDPETRKCLLFRNPDEKQQLYYYSLADAWYSNDTCKLVLRIQDVHPYPDFFHPGSKNKKDERKNIKILGVQPFF